MECTARRNKLTHRGDNKVSSARTIDDHYIIRTLDIYDSRMFDYPLEHQERKTLLILILIESSLESSL